MKIEIGGEGGMIEITPEEYAKMLDIKEAMAMDDTLGLGGYLVPPEYTVAFAVRLGMPPLPPITRWDEFVNAKIGRKPWWYKWLFHNYSTNKIASFLAWRWPKFPDVIAAYNETSEMMHQQQEERVQLACEFLRSRRGE